jgi:hypothetical protein
MGIAILTQNAEIERLISVCKSDSGICGTELRAAHQALGIHLGKLIAETEHNATCYAVIILMRAGLPFGLGIADVLEDNDKDVAVFFSSKGKEIPDGFISTDYDCVILADAVINNGDNILTLVNKLKVCDVIFATNVMSKKATTKFFDKRIYAVRISQNSFKGSEVKTIQSGKGPDTGNRLFNSVFLKR